MHMPNELTSAPVAAGTLTAAALALGAICRVARRHVTPDRIALMGIMGAFVFAAQMINIPLPIPGASGHLVGAVLLAIVLGPWLGTIVLTSVIVLQCLIFQDGGILALGCNVINMALVPCFIGHALYQRLAGDHPAPSRLYIASIVACMVAVMVGAALVPIETALSGVLLVPFITFLLTMLGVHLVIGAMEGLITAAVLAYLATVRPDTLAVAPATQSHRIGRWSRHAVYAGLIVATILTASLLSLLASEKPDGLEWSYAERPNDPSFESVVANTDPVVARADQLQARYTPLPDYSIRSAPSGHGDVDLPDAQPTTPSVTPAVAWTSLAGLIGSALTMGLVWLIGRTLRKEHPASDAPCPN